MRRYLCPDAAFSHLSKATFMYLYCVFTCMIVHVYVGTFGSMRTFTYQKSVLFRAGGRESMYMYIHVGIRG